MGEFSRRQRGCTLTRCAALRGAVAWKKTLCSAIHACSLSVKGGPTNRPISNPRCAEVMSLFFFEYELGRTCFGGHLQVHGKHGGRPHHEAAAKFLVGLVALLYIPASKGPAGNNHLQQAGRNHQLALG